MALKRINKNTRSHTVKSQLGINENKQQTLPFFLLLGSIESNGEFFSCRIFTYEIYIESVIGHWEQMAPKIRTHLIRIQVMLPNTPEIIDFCYVLSFNRMFVYNACLYNVAHTAHSRTIEIYTSSSSSERENFTQWWWDESDRTTYKNGRTEKPTTLNFGLGIFSVCVCVNAYVWAVRADFVCSACRKPNL